MTDLNLDLILNNIKEGKKIEENNLILLLKKLQEILFNENNILELTSPIIIVGDIHGQLPDLFQMFDTITPNGIKNSKFLFLGDYVDRGKQSMDTFTYLATLKLKYSNKIFLLRGNHECRQVNQAYGFYSETIQKYGHSGIWALCNEVFDLLPMAALIDNKVFSVHGGISPEANYLESIVLINRQDELPTTGVLCDLCWSDPDIDLINWKKNERGAGWLFGANQVNEFCHLNNLNFITRSHQLVQEGFQWYFDKKLITIWSAPNYMYRAGNKATIMKYNSEKDFDLVFFDEYPPSKRNELEDLYVSQYFA